MANHDVEDTKEFIESTANAIPSTPEEDHRRAVRNLRAAAADPLMDYDGDEDEPKTVEAFTQYSRVGHGFTPVGATLTKLDAGVYTIDAINGQPIFVPHKIVTDELMRLPDSRSDEVIEEIRKFWELESRFQDLGYCYKRGFILYGPQGSGKTSTVEIVIKQVVRDGNIAFLANGHPGLTSEALRRFRQVEKDRRIVVILEDLDATIENYGESLVLALLDGEDQIDKVVYIATTNYPEKLPPRLANRPSRFDKIVKIGMPNANARRMYLESRKLGLPVSELQYWVEQTNNFSIAHLKELIISVKLYETPVDLVIERLRAMARIPKSDDTGRRTGFVGGDDVPVGKCAESW